MAEVGCPSSSLRSGLWEFSAALAPRQTRAAPVFCTLSQSSVAMLCSSGSPLTSPFTLRALRSAACLTVCSARSSTKVSTFSLLQTAPRPLSGDGVVGEMSLECCHTRQSSSSLLSSPSVGRWSRWWGSSTPTGSSSSSRSV